MSPGDVTLRVFKRGLILGRERTDSSAGALEGKTRTYG
jgi:hypothetical protein